MRDLMPRKARYKFKRYAVCATFWIERSRRRPWLWAVVNEGGHVLLGSLHKSRKECEEWLKA